MQVIKKIYDEKITWRWFTYIIFIYHNSIEHVLIPKSFYDFADTKVAICKQYGILSDIPMYLLSNNLEALQNSNTSTLFQSSSMTFSKNFLWKVYNEIRQTLSFTLGRGRHSFSISSWHTSIYK